MSYIDSAALDVRAYVTERTISITAYCDLRADNNILCILNMQRSADQIISMVHALLIHVI